MRPRLLVACAIALGLALVFAINQDLTPGTPRGPEVDEGAAASEVPEPPHEVLRIPEYLKAAPSWTAGSPDGKVHVDVYYPGLGHGPIKRAAKDIGKRWPKQVYVRYVDWQTQSGAREWGARGLRCGAVVIDEKQVFEVQTTKGNRRIVFHGPPGETKDNYWRIPDMFLVVEKEVQNTYGSAAAPTR